VNRTLLPPALIPVEPNMRLTFTAIAWLKLQYFCHAGDTEIGGFGISAEQDPLLVEDFQTVRQDTTSLSVRLHDEAVAEFFDDHVDAGLGPPRCGRIWCHTRPGTEVRPSTVDEQTLAHCFGHCDWAALVVLGRAGDTYARLSFGVGPGGQIVVPVAVDWRDWPVMLDHLGGMLAAKVESWRREYAANIFALPEGRTSRKISGSTHPSV
jgi:hypothetical protein